MNLVEKAERFDRLMEIFEGTILDGLLDITEEDFIDSDLPLDPDEEIEDELDMLERMIFTITMRRRDDIEKFSQDIDISLDDLYDLYLLFLDDNDEAIFAFENHLRQKFIDSGRKFPQEDWEFMLGDLDDFVALGKIMSHCISSRLSDAEDRLFVIKSGFSIVIAGQPKENDENDEIPNSNLVWKSFFKN